MLILTPFLVLISEKVFPRKKKVVRTQSVQQPKEVRPMKQGGTFVVGDFVTIHSGTKELPGVVLQIDKKSHFGYRVGGDGYDAWFPNWQLAHDLDG